MKTIIAVLFLFPFFSSAQLKLEDPIWNRDSARHIPEQSTTIYVKNVKFIDACNAILDAGLIIDKKDNDLQTVQSIYKFEGITSVWNPIIYIRVKEGVAIIKSEVCFNIGNCHEGFYSEKKRKPKQNAYINGFMQAYKIAKALGTDLSYSK